MAETVVLANMQENNKMSVLSDALDYLFNTTTSMVPSTLSGFLPQRIDSMHHRHKAGILRC